MPVWNKNDYLGLPSGYFVSENEFGPSQVLVLMLNDDLGKSRYFFYVKTRICEIPDRHCATKRGAGKNKINE